MFLAPIWMTSTLSSKSWQYLGLISSVTMGIPVAALASSSRSRPAVPMPWKE